jgi:hypothetical protein
LQALRHAAVFFGLDDSGRYVVEAVWTGNIKDAVARGGSAWINAEDAHGAPNAETAFGV